MNKIIVITALFLFIVSSASFAATITATGGLTAEGDQIYGGPDGAAALTSDNLIGKLSKGVIGGANYTSVNYALITKHTSGTMIFGSADDSTAIYRKTVGTGALGETPSADNNTAFATDWTEM